MEYTIYYVIQGWIARDMNGYLWLYTEEKPTKHDTGCWGNYQKSALLKNSDLPSVKWEDEEPMEIEIKIKKVR